MNKIQFTMDGSQWERISKTAAAAAYMRGSRIALLPCKMRAPSDYKAFCFWMYPHIISKAAHADFVIDETGARNDFYNQVNSYEYYNCNPETGKYSMFFKEAKTA